MKISDNTSISMPMRNLIAIIGAVAVGTMAYFGVIERLNKIETELNGKYSVDCKDE
jgi:type IV secretory pathway VirB2 component (pilin)